MDLVHQDAGDEPPLAPSLPAPEASTDDIGGSRADSHPPHRFYGPDTQPDCAGTTPAADPPLPPAAASPPETAGDEPAPALPDLPPGVEQHVRIVLPPPGPDPLQRRSRRVLAAAVVVLAVAAGAGAGAVVAALTTSRAPQTVIESFLPDPAGTTGVGDPQAILAHVLPAVVSVDAAASPAGISAGHFGRGAGTGMIVSRDGLVLTNAHVIGGARTVSVTLYGQSHPLTAKVVGTDPALDVALLQIEGGVRPFPTVVLGDSATTRQGDDVLAVGNTLALAGGPTVTEGIVSAEGRSVSTPAGPGRPAEHLTGLIQTDAPINAGNSGGPLVDAAAEVIGMNTVVAESAPGNAPAQNVGFAIPVDELKPVLARLERGAGV